MIRRIKKQLSPGVVIGLVALVVAVGGGSFAIAQEGDNTLRTRFGGATKQVVQTVTLLPRPPTTRAFRTTRSPARRTRSWAPAWRSAEE